ncbi:hypothetical protein DSAG12_03905 [Promethearchaeum syntrophicum]|uniref:Uncharacterized protein n=1 Tax=Promethearchaeum syntrophicum TaxID=2594042 RepID=A0A5B9DHF4_9ARCH|nr:hypothetical protein [Candidatus Prometheoarchaeum syntrophicum]QEE18067.1 hypothetical protein DSAG12_03905 [Candidatus Prometheoarchaeum syntrophicum]
MTIEIDDSGTGDLIGSAFILFWRRETNILIKKEVPLKLYQSPDFNNLTKEYIKNLFIETFKEMDIPKTEDIYLCTGNCFDLARIFLKEEEYNYHDAKIEGYLQDCVEQTYLDHIIEEYDVPAHRVSLESGAKRFFSLFHWVYQDFPRRKAFVKSGFPKWKSKWEIEAKNKWMLEMVSNEEKRLSDPKRNSYRKKWSHRR